MNFREKIDALPPEPWIAMHIDGVDYICNETQGVYLTVSADDNTDGQWAERLAARLNATEESK